MKILLAILLTLFIPIVCSAQLEKVRIIDASVDLNFSPRLAYFLLANSKGDIFKRDGVLVSTNSSEEKSAGTLSRYLVGTAIKDSEMVMNYSLLVFGDNGAYGFIPPQDLPNLVSDDSYSSADDLRAVVVSKQQLVAERKQNLDQQTMILKKLRIRAAEISEIAKIIELEEETKRLKDASNELQDDINSLRNALEVVKSVSHPYRFESRKSQLTTQLAEMAEVALRAEQGADTRKQNNEMNIDQKLALIDSTRFEDLGELEQEYLRLGGSLTDPQSSNQAGEPNIDESTMESPIPQLETAPVPLNPDGQSQPNDDIGSEDYFSLSEG